MSIIPAFLCFITRAALSDLSLKWQLSPQMTATEHTDSVNSKILAVSEDQIQGFVREPFSEIARLSGIEERLVLERIKAMLSAGTIRRVRQTLLSTNLAQGALVAWKVPAEKLDSAFDYMFRQDPFSGHVVVRSTDSQTAGQRIQIVDHRQGSAGLRSRGAHPIC